MGVEDIQIVDLFFLGGRRPKPIVVSFESKTQKDIIFQNKSAIKYLVNQDDKPIFINDYLPPSINANKRRHRDIISSNNKKDKIERAKIQVGQGKLFVDDNEYIKKISTPNPTSILGLQSNQIDELMKTKVHRGKTVTIKDSTFIGYTSAVNTFKHIQQLYLKIKLLHADARHITCAYNLEGMDPTHEKDFCDDGEHGAGRALLSWMTRNSLMQRVFFVVRYCQSKIGSDRFQGMIQAAESSLLCNPYNYLTQTNQSISQPKPAYTTSTANNLHNSNQTSDEGARNRGYAAYINRKRGGFHNMPRMSCAAATLGGGGYPRAQLYRPKALHAKRN